MADIQIKKEQKTQLKILKIQKFQNWKYFSETSLAQWLPTCVSGPYKRSVDKSEAVRGDYWERKEVNLPFFSDIFVCSVFFVKILQHFSSLGLKILLKCYLMMWLKAPEGLLNRPWSDIVKSFILFERYWVP